MTQDLSEFLRGVDLLRHVDSGTFDAFAAACKVEQLGPGQTLFAQGDSGQFVFIVREGALEAWANVEGGRRLLRVLGPGQVGGLTSVTLGRPRSATLRAARDTTLVTISRNELLSLLDTHPDLSRSLIAELSAKVRIKTERLASLLEPAGAQGFRVAFFDTKPYDRTSFEALLGDDIQCTWLAHRLDDQSAALAAGHHAVCAFVNDDLSRATLRHLAALGIGLVAMRCAGFNNVDVSAAKELGLCVVRVPAYSPHAVAEHALALLLTLNRKIHRAHNRVKEGNFSLAGLVGDDLHGQTAGVIGLGKIGQCAARLFRGFGMRVLAADPVPDAAFLAEGVVEHVELDVLVEQSNIISLHCPLMPATHHLIDARRLAQMKPGVTLINTSRGGLVDTSALIDALKSGKIGAAGLDVYEEESEYFFEDRSDRVITDDVLARLMTFNNVLVTSHQGFLTHRALHNIAETTLGSIRAYAAQGRLPSNDQRLVCGGS